LPKICCQQGARQPDDIISESAGDFADAHLEVIVL
jgi:hypothetical protein